jgi:hypothetical protein
MQAILIRKCTVGKNKGVPDARKNEQRQKIIAALTNGTISLRRFHFRRVGFNRALYNRLLGIAPSQALAAAGGNAELEEVDDHDDDQDDSDRD